MCRIGGPSKFHDVSSAMSSCRLDQPNNAVRWALSDQTGLGLTGSPHSLCGGKTRFAVSTLCPRLSVWRRCCTSAIRCHCGRWWTPRRTPEHGNLLHAEGGEGAHRTLATARQHHPTPATPWASDHQPQKLPCRARLCRPTLRFSLNNRALTRARLSHKSWTT